MDYKVKIIRDCQCFHKIFGVTCKRNEQIYKEMEKKIHRLKELSDKKLLPEGKNPTAVVLNEVLSIGETEMERLMISNIIGESHGSFSSIMGAVKGLVEGQSGNDIKDMIKKDKEKYVN